MNLWNSRRLINRSKISIARRARSEIGTVVDIIDRSNEEADYTNRGGAEIGTACSHEF